MAACRHVHPYGAMSAVWMYLVSRKDRRGATQGTYVQSHRRRSLEFSGRGSRGGELLHVMILLLI